MAKGADFEREICKYLSLWVQGTEKPYLFWRQILSGGLATISAENSEFSGDIHSVSPKSAWFTDIFSIELKTGYKKTSFWQLFANIKHFNIEEFWLQCTDDATKSDRAPMLIYKKLGRKPIIGIDLIVENKLGKYLSKLPSMSIRFQDNRLETVVFYDFKDFFDAITPKIFKGKLWRK